MGLNRKNGTLKGVRADVYNPDKEEWEKQGVIGYTIPGVGFLLGIQELNEYGYKVEVEISEKALRRMVDAIADAREETIPQDNFENLQVLPASSFSEAPAEEWDWLEGDFPT